ncbi:Cysteine synthase A [Spironucleus salmonicida]|uniref:Cysteine synthase A n=1 Tax=Spironucleus salmonicida TaxID=348837 RepID=V6M5Z8_9EUKA|nr:Cysteine synthase A [Spironucleus salmonicida]|eukprot:EST48784.1 Cysteine synthase A [Spironucleus salmonicida]
MTLITEELGKTPLIRLQQLPKGGRVFCKYEAISPGGSIKDRVAIAMLKDLISQNRITPKTRLIEPTSGNTGVALALVCAAYQIPLTIVMPSNMSIERRLLIQGYGANLILTESTLGTRGAIAKCKELMDENKNYISLGQFDNQANVKAHECTTGVELVNQCKEYNINPKFFVVGCGTGGTISGASIPLKAAFPELKSIALEPEKAIILETQKACKPQPHVIQGIGTGFIPQVYNPDIVDEIMQINDDQALNTTKLLARKEGILAGVSSGANVYAAIQYASKYDCDVITILPDTGERYMSLQGIFEDLDDEDLDEDDD